MSIKALLIGCGKIGAGYDIANDEKIFTHLKAYVLNPEIDVTIYDQDSAIAAKMSALYDVPMVKSVDKQEYKKFDIISIATPSNTHVSYLIELLNSAVPVIICEKPVVTSYSDVFDLKEIYVKSRSKVLVNYMRRFLPGIARAKENIKKEIGQRIPSAIVIKYKRGVLNNATHAIDLIEYLFDNTFQLHNFKVFQSTFDSFDYDPTITGACFFDDCQVNFIGLNNADYPVFEIEFYFPAYKIVMYDSGNEIRYYKNNHELMELEEVVTARQGNILDRYMEPVINKAIQLFYKKETDDNFISTLDMNERVLRIIESATIN
jgi:predicted dehydrogenase